MVSGSHADAIPLAGAYDGTLGVIGPIAAVAALRRAGYRPRAPIDVLMFTSEEPTRFGLGCIGRCVKIGIGRVGLLLSKITWATRQGNKSRAVAQSGKSCPKENLTTRQGDKTHKLLKVENPAPQNLGQQDRPRRQSTCSTKKKA